MEIKMEKKIKIKKIKNAIFGRFYNFIYNYKIQNIILNKKRKKQKKMELYFEALDKGDGSQNLIQF